MNRLILFKKKLLGFKKEKNLVKKTEKSASGYGLTLIFLLTLRHGKF